jgi:hypothetical protein
LFVFASLGLPGCGSSGKSDAAPDQPHAYSEAVIDRFVTACLQRSRASVAQCACVLERYRQTVPEDGFVQAISAAQTDPQMTDTLAQCGLDSSQGFAATPPSAPPSKAVAGSPAAASTPSPQPAATVRAATRGEACVQEKLAAASAGGKSVPLDVYDKIRAECGA